MPAGTGAQGGPDIDTNTPPRPIPASIITGFLGSGKTTLLARLLGDPRMEKAAVIINEFGEVGLDHLLVTRPREDVVLLASGCLCCTLRGDLVNTLASLHRERAQGDILAFDRVLVETTGLADPAPVLLTVTADPDLSPLFGVEKVIATVDAVHGPGQLRENPESVKQACVADVLLITKTDLAERGQPALLREQLRQLNPSAEIRVAIHGEIDPDCLFRLSLDSEAAPEREVRRLLTSMQHAGHEADQHHVHTHGANGDVQSFVITLEEEATLPGLQMWMGMLRDFHGPNLLRIKGLLNLEGRPIVLQAVQNMLHPLAELSDWPGPDRRSHIVFITRDIDRSMIERTTGVLTLHVPPSAPGSLIDPEAFRRFAEAASKFHA